MKTTLLIAGVVIAVLAVVQLTSLSHSSSEDVSDAIPITNVQTETTPTADYTLEELEQAVRFGEENKFDNLALTKIYRVNYNLDYGDWLIVFTPWAQLASAAQDKARAYESLTQDQVNAYATDNVLQIAALSYGGEMDFADRFQGIIKMDSEVIRPMKQQNSDNLDTTAAWPDYPQYGATTEFAFDDFSRFKGKKFTFVLIKPDSEKTFEIDLLKLK